MNGVALEAGDREHNRRRDVNGYIHLRRRTCGGFLVFLLVEFALNIPDEVMDDPSLEALTQLGVDMIMIVNVRFPVSFPEPPLTER